MLVCLIPFGHSSVRERCGGHACILARWRRGLKSSSSCWWRCLSCVASSVPACCLLGLRGELFGGGAQVAPMSLSPSSPCAFSSSPPSSSSCAYSLSWPWPSPCPLPLPLSSPSPLASSPLPSWSSGGQDPPTDRCDPVVDGCDLVSTSELVSMQWSQCLPCSTGLHDQQPTQEMWRVVCLEGPIHTLLALAHSRVGSRWHSLLGFPLGWNLCFWDVAFHRLYTTSWIFQTGLGARCVCLSRRPWSSDLVDPRSSATLVVVELEAWPG